MDKPRDKIVAYNFTIAKNVLMKFWPKLPFLISVLKFPVFKDFPKVNFPSRRKRKKTNISMNKTKIYLPTSILQKKSAVFLLQVSHIPLMKIEYTFLHWTSNHKFVLQIVFLNISFILLRDWYKLDLIK